MKRILKMTLALAVFIGLFSGCINVANDPPVVTPTLTKTITLTQTTGGTISVSEAKSAYSIGDVVTFTATPDSGYAFGSWTGISGTTSSVSVTIADNLTVSAAFTALPMYRLTSFVDKSSLDGISFDNIYTETRHYPNASTNFFTHRTRVYATGLNSTSTYFKRDSAGKTKATLRKKTLTDIADEGKVYTYDAKGLLYSVDKYPVKTTNGEPGSIANTELYTYDSQDRIITLKFFNYLIYTYFFDTLGVGANYTTHEVDSPEFTTYFYYAYDARNNIIEEAGYSDTSKTTLVYKYINTYDTNNNCIKYEEFYYDATHPNGYLSWVRENTYELFTPSAYIAPAATEIDGSWSTDTETYTFNDGIFYLKTNSNTGLIGTYTIDTSQTPHTIDFGLAGETPLGLYKIEGNTLTLAINFTAAGARPSGFDAASGITTRVLTKQ